MSSSASSSSPPRIDPTLHKPRILCLHGGGTNTRIFRAQCRVLERRLESTFRLCYTEAPFASQPGPDVVSVYKDYGPFKAWLRWTAEDPYPDANSAIEHITDALLTAMDDDDRRGATGEWVGLLGFSQGAKICASLLYMQQAHQEQGLYGWARDWPNFHFAVLLAGRGPLISLMPDVPVPRGLVSASEPASTAAVDDRARIPATDLVKIPTIHLHGLQDPGLYLHRRLLHDYFDMRQVRLLEWDGGHRVPIKTKDVNPLIQEMISIAAETGVVWSSEFDWP